MSKPPIQIARYPNRRFYARSTSKYVSLQEIAEIVQSGSDVEIRDSQTDEDLTRAVLTRIIMEQQPEKMRLIPTAMLHFILRSNEVMTGFLRDYFQHSLTYLEYLQKHGSTAPALTSPMHWVKAWLDGIAPRSGSNQRTASAQPVVEAEEPAGLAQRLEQLEARLKQLESKDADTEQTSN